VAGVTTGTKEWKPNNENCIEGCENDCLYCYAALMAAQYKRITRDQWHTMKPNARSQKPVRFLEGGVMFPTTHDLHMRHVNWWSPFLTDLLDVGNDVLIVSKPEFAAIRFICDNFYSKVNQIEFRFTIGTDSEIARSFWEPNAPNIGERIQALRYAFERGYKTSVSMEPLLMKDPRRLIWQISPWIYESGTIWIGLMNHMRENWITDELSHRFYDEQKTINSKENMQKIYDSLKDYPQIRWKDSVRELLGIQDA
jgi:DNA repair photolyase